MSDVVKGDNYVFDKKKFFSKYMEWIKIRNLESGHENNPKIIECTEKRIEWTLETTARGDNKKQFSKTIMPNEKDRTSKNIKTEVNKKIMIIPTVVRCNESWNLPE